MKTKSEKKKKSGLYRLEFFSGLVFTSAYLVFITAKIASMFISLSAVHIYDFHSLTVPENKFSIARAVLKVKICRYSVVSLTTTVMHVGRRTF